jgi:hypothetical protein
MKLKFLPISLYKSLKYRLKSNHILTYPLGNELDVAVSLTAIPSRFRILDLTLASVFSQVPKPKHIYLWINEDHIDLIPKRVKKMEGDILKIKSTPLHSAHKKLIHTLQEQPDLPVVTCDDDVLYRQNWLNTLYESHIKYPNFVIAHRGRTITFNENNELTTYEDWHYDPNASFDLFKPIGVNGVLYPPHVFSNLIHNQELFMKLAPKNDDVWFKTVQLVEGIKARKADRSPKPPIPIPGTQYISLRNVNVKQGKNDEQWKNCIEYFNLDLLSKK